MYALTLGEPHNHAKSIIFDTQETMSADKTEEFPPQFSHSRRLVWMSS